MKILLLGKNGQLGWELQRALPVLGQLVALDRKGNSLLCGDLAKLSDLAKTVRAIKPDIVVNAAAYTDVDKAETEPELARLINVQAPEILAQEVAALNAWLVHYSSDYVFDGQGSKPWKESDPAAPLNVYGLSKLEGERAIQASGCQHLIFRTSWVYGRWGNNFAKTMLALARERDELSVVADQIGVPTGADFLADSSVHALSTVLKRPDLGGIYHLVPHGEISWYDYAHFVIEHAKAVGENLQLKTITPIPSSDYPTKALRPLNSRLAATKFSDTFAWHLPHWEVGVTRMLQEIRL